MDEIFIILSRKTENSLLYFQNIVAYRVVRGWITQCDGQIFAWQEEISVFLRRMDELSIVIKGCKQRLR